jgi:hypothetical protein
MWNVWRKVGWQVRTCVAFSLSCFTCSSETIFPAPPRPQVGMSGRQGISFDFQLGYSRMTKYIANRAYVIPSPCSDESRADVDKVTGRRNCEIKHSKQDSGGCHISPPLFATARPSRGGRRFHAEPCRGAAIAVEMFDPGADLMGSIGKLI